MTRTRFQGVGNIIRFNWPFYAWAAVLVISGFAGAIFGIGWVRTAGMLVAVAVALPTIVTLTVSWYVYDLSGLYHLDWLDVLPPQCMANVNAGFDEISGLLEARFPHGELSVFDFYDPAKHTAPSIARARSAYPLYPGAREITTVYVPAEDTAFDMIFVIMATHEIRDAGERAKFFRELRRTLTPDGRIVVAEHLCDTANLLAYNVGAFHFHGRRSWLRTFTDAGLGVQREAKPNPFVTVFFLIKDGTQP